MLKSISFGGQTYYNITTSQAIELGIPADVAALAEKEQAIFDVEAERRRAYKEESDPLFMEWQFDGTPESESKWRDKVSEIKVRIPFPAE